MTSIIITENAVKRIAFLLESEPEGKFLRIEVDGGGCSGFQYKYDFDDKIDESEDVIVDKSGVKFVIDKISLDYLKDSTFDYVETLGAASFQISNPQATATCGCGNSFAV